MKSSKIITLVMLGTIVSACGSDDRVEYHQNQYRSQADCQKDWGKDAKDCAPKSGGGGYVGPRYIWSGGTPVAVYPDNTSKLHTDSYLARGTQTTAIGAVRSVGLVPSSAHSLPGVSAARSSFAARAGSGFASARGGFGSSASAHASGGS
jgi:hypothetical protein